MTTITVNASKSYPIKVGEGIFDQAGEQIASLCSGALVAIISDDTVYNLYGEYLKKQVEEKGFRAVIFTFPAGEQSKNLLYYGQILNFLAENQVTRSDLLVALGGGVVGDMAGFAAATFLRGIPFVQIPTTLLAMVDSSVGGKTAVDLPAGKNLVGAFYQPSLVICDPNLLNTLPENTFRDGCAEVIKYAVLFSPSLFEHLEKYGLSFHREDVICQCISWKRDIVAQDEFDLGMRQLLNLGHTIGHGIEAASSYSVTHGEAVAMGMAIIARICKTNNICTSGFLKRLESLLNSFGLPVKTCFTADDIYVHMLKDKKRQSKLINLILPREIGDCVIVPYPIDDLKSIIEAGL